MNEWTNSSDVFVSLITDLRFGMIYLKVDTWVTARTVFSTALLVALRKWREPPHDKTNKMTARPAKTDQISLGIRPVWSESSLCAQWVSKDPSFLKADSEDSDQTGRMPRLIFAGRTVTLLVLSRRSSRNRRVLACCMRMTRLDNLEIFNHLSHL